MDQSDENSHTGYDEEKLFKLWRWYYSYDDEGKLPLSVTINIDEVL
jgi:hypothetical protein